MIHWGRRGTYGGRNAGRRGDFRGCVKWGVENVNAGRWNILIGIYRRSVFC